MSYTLQFGQIWPYLPYLAQGALVSLWLAFLAFLGGMVIGLLGAMGKTFGPFWLQRLIQGYVVFLTNTPQLVQIYFLYFALPDAGILLSSYQAVLIGMTLNAGAYLTEIQRAGFLSVRREELEAAETLGMSRLQSVRYVILPHIMRILFPPLSNQYILMTLGTSMAAIFGVEDFHLYLHRARARGVAVELSDPPAILVPSAVAELSEAHRVFTLARALSDVATGLYAVDKLTPRELEIVLASISRRAAPGFGAGLTSEDILDDIGKRLSKALPRRARKGVDELATAYVSADGVDLAHFDEAVVTSANRVALLVCDDLLAAAECLQRTERDLADLSGPALLRHPMVSRLLRFWVSPEAGVLRQRCGLAG